MDGNSEEYAVPESCRYPKSSAYPESVEKRMDEDGDTRNERHVIVVFVRIFVGMIPVFMIVFPFRKELFHEVYNQKTSHERIYGEMTRFE